VTGTRPLTTQGKPAPWHERTQREPPGKENQTQTASSEEEKTPPTLTAYLTTLIGAAAKG